MSWSTDYTLFTIYFHYYSRRMIHIMFKLLLMLIMPLAYTVFSQTIKPVVSTTTPKVCTHQAGCMLGKLMPGYQIESFEAFLGIPYALPPVGELRFSNPKSFPRWLGVLNATEPKEDCIQKNYLIPDPQVTGSEDCLYLNVFRPKLKKHSLEKLPVMVYIHGGGWFSGTANPAITGPEYFMDTQQVILVTFSYRLGALGFLSTNDLNMPGNFGLKDQVMALKWVQKNIAEFGGNPKMVTLFGQSAGAISAHMHMLSKQSEGLFHAIIALSGTANVPFALTEKPLEQARLTAELCNVTNAQHLSTTKLVKALRGINAQTLVNAGDGLKYWHVDHMTNYRPVVERFDKNDAFLIHKPKKLLKEGKFNPRPIMMGGVPNEGAVRVAAIMESEKLRNSFNANFSKLLETFLEFPTNFTRLQLNTKMDLIIKEYFQGEHELNENTRKGFLDLVTDRGFHHPYFNAIKSYVNTIDTNRFPIYLYNFNYTGPYSYSTLYTGGPTEQNYGVVHCDDLLYLFRSPLLFPDFEKDSAHAQVIKAFVENFVHFAKYKKPLINAVNKVCNKTAFTEGSAETICHYQQFQNGPNNNSQFLIKTENRFNIKRMHLWDTILEE